MRPRLLLAFLVLAAATFGCSLAKLGGKYADWYAMKRLDEAFALTQAQETALRPRVREHIAWIKKTEIPVVVGDLDELMTRIKRGVVAEDRTWVEGRIDALKTRLDQRLRPDAVWLLAQMDAKQHAHMKDEMADKSEDWRDSVDESPEHYKRDRLKRYEKMYKEWLGPMSDEQRKDLHERFAALAELEAGKLLTEGRIEAYGAFLNAVAPPGDAARVDAFLTTWIKDPAALRSDAAAKAFRERQRTISDGWLAIGQRLTPAQRDHLLEKLKDHRDDLAAFAKAE